MDNLAQKEAFLKFFAEQLLHYLNKNREVAMTPIPNQTRVGDSMQNEGRRPLGRSSRIPAWGSEVSGGGKRRDRRGAMKRQGPRGLSAPDLMTKVDGSGGGRRGLFGAPVEGRRGSGTGGALGLVDEGDGGGEHNQQMVGDREKR